MIKIKYTLLLFVALLYGNRLAAQNLSFGMFTDIHYAAIPDNGSRKYSQSLEKVAQCIDSMNRQKVDFVIELGDFKDMPNPPDSKSALGFLEDIEKYLSR